MDQRSLTDKFEGRVEAWLKRLEIEPKTKSIVAFSGGPDSTALLAALVAIGAGPLRALYVDHGIRPRSEREAERGLVARTALSLDVDFQIAEIQEGLVAATAKAKGIGIEAAARLARHESLRACAADFAATRIYIGHTRDDDLEGLLMRFLNGAGTAGLRGLRGVQGRIVRPLLEIGRPEIEAYLRAKGIAASLDSTNSDEDILRNRVRRRLVPLLDAEFAFWRGGVLRTAGRLSLDDEALTELAGDVVAVKAADSSRLIPYEDFAALPEGLRFRILAACIDGLVMDGLCPEFPGNRVPARMLGSILESLSRGRSFSGHGLSIRREGDGLKVGPSLDFEGADGYFVVLNESDIGFERSVPGGVIALAWTDDPDMAGIPEGSFDFPLVVRRRRPGDSIALASGQKAIDRIVGSWGLHASFRNGISVVQDRRGIVGLLGSSVPRGKDIFRIVASGAPVRRRLSLRLKGA